MPNTFSRSPLHLPHALRSRWVKRPGYLDLWPFDRQNGVRVTCDLGYLCANFGLPRPLFSQLSPDVRDRHTSDRNQTSDVRQKHRLIPPPIRRAGHNNHAFGLSDPEFPINYRQLYRAAVTIKCRLLWSICLCWAFSGQKQRNLSKSTWVIGPPFPFEFRNVMWRGKTRMIALPDGEKIV